MDLAKFYKTQISLSEWFANAGHDDMERFRVEDNEKRERLRVLEEILGLPFDKPKQFSARDIADKTEELEKFVAEHGDELCALRLIPLESDLPKLRMRGVKVKDVLDWFVEQNVDPDKYKADFVPHTESLKRSTIFVVNSKGIFGEFIDGMHAQLTQGFYNEQKPIQFGYSFDTGKWWLSEDDVEVLNYLKDIVGRLKVEEVDKKEQLAKRLESQFANDYLKGYFETGYSEEFGLWYFDYNRILGEMYEDFLVGQLAVAEDDSKQLRGRVGSPGKAKGKVRIVKLEQLGKIELEEGEILVCDMTTPDYLPLMKRSGAIVTDRGGVLTHAAIVARELGKPCIVATEWATQVLRDGDVVEVDAMAGVVNIIG